MSDSTTEKLHAILAAMRSDATHRRAESAGGRDRLHPFVTISREAGAGGWSLCEQLVDRLHDADPGQRRWTGWDRELLDKVARDTNLPREVVEELDERSVSWIEDFFGNLSFSDPTQMVSGPRVYRRVFETIRALAIAGRTVIVGRGGVYITSDFPNGLHVRLIAPFEYRVENLASRQGLSQRQAKEEVQRIDRRRNAFYRQYWSDRVRSPYAFSVTFNTARLSDEQLVEGVVAMVPQASASRAEAGGSAPARG